MSVIPSAILRGLCLLVACAWTGAASAAQAKNVIILVADGGGFNAFAAGSLYEHGRLGAQVHDGPAWLKLASHTASIDTFKARENSQSDLLAANDTNFGTWDIRPDGNTAGPPFKGYKNLLNVPTDSAASATTMATGIKTRNGRVNYVPDGDDEVPAFGKNISEIARSLGKSAGVVTTVQWNDATPACFGAAHNIARSGRRDIANEMLSADVLDVIMGGGHPEYDKNAAPRTPASEADYDIVGGSYTWQQLKSQNHAGGWKLVETRAQFASLLAANPPRKVFGLARVSNALQSERNTQDWNRDGRIDAADLKFAPAFKDPFNANLPDLPLMANGALNILARNPKGFFLMIEGGAVDKAAHANHPGRWIENQVEFNHTVAAVVEWVNKYSSWDDTLIIITADHETGLAWGPNSDNLPYEPLINRGAARMPGVWYNTGGHSASLVPIKARGQGAALFNTRILGRDPVRGPYVDNTIIFEVMKAALTGAPLPDPPTHARLDTDSTSPKSSSTTKPSSGKAKTTSRSSTRPKTSSNSAKNNELLKDD